MADGGNEKENKSTDTSQQDQERQLKQEKEHELQLHKATVATEQDKRQREILLQRQQQRQEKLISAKRKYAISDKHQKIKDRIARHKKKLQLERFQNPSLVNKHSGPQRFYFDVRNVLKQASTSNPAPVNEDARSATFSVDTEANKSNILDYVDSVRSGESLIKFYNFDTSNYNADTQKCVAFWRTIMYKTNFRPAQSVSWELVNRVASERRNFMTDIEKFGHDADEDGEKGGKYIWYTTLMAEMQKQKMDEVAFAATAQKCKLCGREEPNCKFRQKQDKNYFESELLDHEDITCLNEWVSTSKAKPKSSSVGASKQPKILPMVKEKKCRTCTSACEFCVCEEKSKKTPERKKCNICTIECDDCFCNAKNDVTMQPNYEDSHFPTLGEDAGRLTCSQNLQKPKSSQSVKNVIQNKHDKNSSPKTEATQDLTNNYSSTEEHKIRSKCAECNKIHCECTKHLDQEASQFLDHLQFNLKNIKRDKFTTIEKQEEKEEKTSTVQQHCIICGHNDCSCKIPQIEARPKYFKPVPLPDCKKMSFLIKEKTSSENLLTTAQIVSMSLLRKSISGSLRTSISQQERGTGSQVPVKLSSAALVEKYSSHNRLPSLPGLEQKSKTIANKSVIIVEPQQKSPSVAIQSSEIKLSPLKVATEHQFSNSSIFETQPSGDEPKRESSKRLPKPMLWYSSEMPQKKDVLFQYSRKDKH